MKYDVYQYQVDEASYSSIEEYLSTLMMATKETIMNASKHYKKVATIEAPSLEKVFDIGNLGLEEDSLLAEHITMHSKMRSVSVGDIIVDQVGDAKYVAPIGFEEIPFKP